MLQKYTQMVAVTKCIITKNKKTQEYVDAYN
ncbi:D-fructose-6-phosphate amidotransferase [Streptococcus oralis subsp. tigurinus]|uniref:D-fructose-6-phosphate amidotransferase n=1 Tax=Streptococcus oralis subsp. tigurinus TaxID=1077464 RepID=A0A1X1GH85_STROR|nr:D-fructose-6-phosphate amidotransferase [Streptococcus oralis subsp. tigurinus]